jgi:hypothetical protein
MQAGKYKKLKWLVCAFALVKNNDTTKLADYDIISDLTGYSFFNPETNSIEKIENVIVGEPLFKFKDNLTISPNDIPNLKETIETTYGRLIFNWLLLVEPFKNKIDYINNKVNLGTIEDFILSRLKDNPSNIEERKQEEIYIDEYLKYSESVFFLTGLSQLCTQAATEKVLQAPPGLKEYKNELLEKYKDSLNDMATVAKIEQELIKFDSDYLKGDAGEDFLISKKSRNIVRKKMFLMNGAEAGLDDNTVSAPLIVNSLNEGWDISKFSDMNNTLRAGSFNRGAQTELGGVAVKWLLRASSNINVTVDDCGSVLGSPMDIDESNKNKLIGFSIIDKGQSKEVNTDEDASSYLGKRIMLRNPMYCKLDKTDYCKTCVGKRLTLNPTGLSIAVSEYGSIFLSIFMSAAHSRSLELAKMDLEKAIF